MSSSAAELEEDNLNSNEGRPPCCQDERLGGWQGTRHSILQNITYHWAQKIFSFFFREGWLRVRGYAKNEAQALPRSCQARALPLRHITPLPRAKEPFQYVASRSVN